MRTLRKLIYREVLMAVAFTTLAFLALMFFFDFVEQLGKIGRSGLTVMAAVVLSALDMPARFYELFPITVLIGSIYALSRMAQSSEFTILRTGGLGPGQALGLLSVLGLAFAALTLFFGDVLAPAAEQKIVALRAAATGTVVAGPSDRGAWLRERQDSPDGLRQAAVRVQRLGADGRLGGVDIFEMNATGRLTRHLEAKGAWVDEAGRWTLEDVMEVRWLGAGAATQTERQATVVWNSQLSASVVSAAVLPVATMTTWELWRYMGHLSRQEQAFQQHAIAFWKKAVYPLACFVMLGLALPFAYLHARGGGVSWRVFGGIMIGISFMVFNHLSGHLGLLQGWSPWVAASAPGLFYLGLSLGAFAWLVRYR